MSVATAVVANPVIVPRADLQIPAVQLSGTGDAMDMLNNDFLNAIGPTQAESSSNPFEVLKDLVSSLAADATYLTRNAIVSAFFAGATAVTNPELTAASYPYIPASDVPGGPAVVPSAVGTTGGAWPVSTDQLLAAAVLPSDLVPAAAEVVTALMDDLHGLSDSAVVRAAFAAGALLVTEGGQVVDTVRNLVDHGVEAALTDVLTAVGSGEPQKAIIRAIRSVIELPLFPKTSAVWPSAMTSIDVAPPIEPTSIDEQASISAGLPTSPTPSAEAVGAERAALRKPAQDSPALLPRPAAGQIEPEISLPAILKDGTDPATRVRIPARPTSLHDALSQARNQAHGILHNAADAISKAADHAAKAAAGPTGD